jgi:hypothetical protein
VTSELDSGPHTLNWLIANFVHDTDGVRDAVAVSSDGLLVAMSAGLDRASADRLAALVAGLTGLARSASRTYGYNELRLIMIEMGGGFLLVSAMATGGCIAVLADSHGDIGLIGYEIATLVDRVGGVLTPALITELREALPQ